MFIRYFNGAIESEKSWQKRGIRKKYKKEVQGRHCLHFSSATFFFLLQKKKKKKKNWTNFCFIPSCIWSIHILIDNQKWNTQRTTRHAIQAFKFAIKVTKGTNVRKGKLIFLVWDTIPVLYKVVQGTNLRKHHIQLLLNPLSPNPRKWSSTLKQFVGC